MELNAWFANFEHQMDDAVPPIVAETATEFFKERFRTQEWDGVPWPDLNPKYAASKTRGRGRILVARGILLNSIHPSTVNAGRVVISAGGPQVPYARAHNEGLRIRGIRQVRGYTNTNFMGTGRSIQIKAHARRVDYQLRQRRFMGHSPILNQTLINRLTTYFNQK